MAATAPGQIITFYSYKGGTGRSMALANVGYLLARQMEPGSRGVLMIDWDLEAPGLHRYFQGALRRTFRAAADKRSLDLHPGLIDFFEAAEALYEQIPAGAQNEERRDAAAGDVRKGEARQQRVEVRDEFAERAGVTGAERFDELVVRPRQPRRCGLGATG